MKSRNKKRLLALVLCMVVAISNSSFIFASETGQAEYPQEAEVQTQDEAVANDMDVAAYAADEGQAVADEQPAAVEQVAGSYSTLEYVKSITLSKGNKVETTQFLCIPGIFFSSRRPPVPIDLPVPLQKGWAKNKGRAAS